MPPLGRLFRLDFNNAGFLVGSTASKQILLPRCFFTIIDPVRQPPRNFDGTRARACQQISYVRVGTLRSLNGAAARARTEPQRRVNRCLENER